MCHRFIDYRSEPRIRGKAGDIGHVNLEVIVEYTEMEDFIDEVNNNARSKEQKL